MTNEHKGRYRMVRSRKHLSVVMLMLLGGVMAIAVTVNGNTASATTSRVKRCTQADVLTCTAANQRAVLVAGAKLERQVVWDTTMRQAQIVQPLVTAFNKIYPYINVKFTIESSTQAEITNIATAWSAQRYNADLVDSTTGPITFQAAGDMQKFWSPNLANYLAAQKSAKSGPVYWTAAINYYLVAAYNTNLVTGKLIPKTYKNLLNPAFKGKIAIPSSAGTGGPFFIGNLILSEGTTKALAYLSQLSKQDVAVLAQAGPVEVQDVANGQYEIGLMAFDDQAYLAKSQGQPLGLAFLQPVPATFSAIGILSHAPDPGAALLLLNFITSKLGQTVIRNGQGLPALPSLAPTAHILAPKSGGWKVNFVKPAVNAFHEGQWVSLFEKYFG